MCVASLVSKGDWYSSKCALTWKTKDTKSNRLLFQLAPSVRRIGEIGCGLLPIATTQEVEHPKAELSKTGRRIAKNGNTHSLGIADRIAMLKTPSASEAEGGVMNLKKARENGWKPKFKMRDQIGDATGLKLQPAFALWMMGYPTDWLDLEDGEMLPSKARATPSSPK